MGENTGGEGENINHEDRRDGYYGEDTRGKRSGTEKETKMVENY